VPGQAQESSKLSWLEFFENSGVKQLTWAMIARGVS
jgi:hypothetical protein